MLSPPPNSLHFTTESHPFPPLTTHKFSTFTESEQEFEPPKEKPKTNQNPTVPRCQQGLTNPTKSKLVPETSFHLFPWKPNRKSKS